MKNVAPYAILIIILLLNSCSATRRAARSSASSGPAPDYAIEYLNRYSALAVSEMKRTGIPASITLAQGMLESNYGRSRLATQGNNHFGIKCHSSWTGKKIYHDDNRRNECFRAYRSAEESYRDHSEFLVAGSRYRDLFRLSNTDYKGWAHGLKKAGYATDPKYPELLIRKIEEYRLWAYDTGSAGQAVTARADKSTVLPPADAGAPAPAASKPAQPEAKDSAGVEPAPARTVVIQDTEEPIGVISLGDRKELMENNNVEYIIVEEGDTYESLAERHLLLSWEISRYNDLAPGTPLNVGQIIYLQPKRSKAAREFLIHTVEAGETMHDISQKYAVRLSSLYKMNLMEEGGECKPGQKLRLR
ncbi:MAG: LysM peptidoglycan-binding domain-containing protein [Bacteroidales bacterium]|jgi:LysM repeat protein|nr:LysM peptidoglycan-binding domain-containing protein [Bacteroidales bacterium]